MKCQNCGFEVAQGELFCGNCGAKVERSGTTGVKLCENCGSEMKQTEKFCGVCGHSSDGLSEGLIEGKARKKQSSHFLIVFIVILITLILIASAIIFYILTTKNDEEPNIPINEEVENTQQLENNNELSNEPGTVQPIVNDENATDYIENNEVDQTEYDRNDDEDNDAEIPIAEPNNSAVYDDYLFSSDKEYITIEYLSTLTKAEIGLIRNEIYARHGYVFETEEYANYFKSKSWYHADPNFDPSSLSEIELTNVNTILAYEKQMGWR